MTTTVEAIYENGSLTLPAPLPLPEKAHVIVTIESGAHQPDDPDRAAWMQVSAERLSAMWSPEDDVFNELLEK